ncbi:MAG TPA: hypothetical protein ENN46_02645 [Candidatus Woesearchaeota archaeon]|nr:hypothetical protein [Candidatus Woesearchaeota archaeon]
MIIRKNLSIFFRNKSSSIIMVLGTFLILFALVSFFSEDSQVVHVSYFLNQSSETSEAIISLLADSGFILHEFPTEEGCVSSVSEGKSKICLSFPDNLEISEDYNESLFFYIDTSRINVVYYILDQVMSEFSEYSSRQRHRLIGDMLLAIDNVSGMLDEAEAQLREVSKDLESAQESLLDLQSELSGIDVSYPNLNALNFSQSASSLITRFRQASSNSNKFRRLSQGLISAMEDCGCDVNQSYRDTLNQTSVSHFEVLNNSDSLIKSLSANVNSFTKFYSDSTKSFDDIEKMKKSVSSDIKGLLDLVDDALTEISLVSKALKDSNAEFERLEIRKAEKILEPISTSIVPVTESSKLGIAIPSVFLILLASSSLLFSSSLVIFNRDSRGGLRETLSHKPRLFFYFSILASSLILVIGQALVFMLVVVILLSLSLNVFLMLAFVSACSAILFSFGGILIGNISDSKEMAFFFSIVVTLILLVLSGEILPVEFIAEPFQSLIVYNPYEVLRASLHRIIIHGATGFDEMLFDFAYIGILAAVLLFLSFFSFSTFRKLRTSRLYKKERKPAPKKTVKEGKAVRKRAVKDKRKK